MVSDPSSLVSSFVSGSGSGGFGFREVIFNE